MGFNDFHSRYQGLGTVKVGDVVNWDTNVRWGRGFDNGTVTKVTKTQVTVYNGHQELKFRWSTANRMYRCTQEFGDAYDMITQATADARDARNAKEDAEKAIQKSIRTVGAQLDSRFTSLENLEAAILELRAQAEAMKALQS